MVGTVEVGTVEVWKSELTGAWKSELWCVEDVDCDVNFVVLIWPVCPPQNGGFLDFTASLSREAVLTTVIILLCNYVWPDACVLHSPTKWASTNWTRDA